ncbi:MAG: NUDIX hydrolase [Bacteroidia bacterium]|nr:NUDIX hydrolase [Bacteroidia bacterium]MDW8334473.1 NUDIX hydrolase [Bacteroidia bacterium]
MGTFNIRVYGLWVENRNLLLVDEIVNGTGVTKMPGGGLEFGEGILDCLHREWMEETGLPILSAEHFYTTDFFVASVFNPNRQIVSVYYRVRCPLNLPIRPRDGESEIKGFRWVELSQISPDIFTFPIDRKVVAMLKEREGL